MPPPEGLRKKKVISNALAPVQCMFRQLLLRFSQTFESLENKTWPPRACVLHETALSVSALADWFIWQGECWVIVSCVIWKPAGTVLGQRIHLSTKRLSERADAEAGNGGHCAPPQGYQHHLDTQGLSIRSVTSRYVSGPSFASPAKEVVAVASGSSNTFLF